MGESVFTISLILFNIIFVGFLLAIVIFIRSYRVKKRAHNRELQTKESLHREELLKTQVEIQVQTMEHIGREIHDNVGQKLTLSSLYLQQMLQGELSDKVQNQIEQVNEIINGSLEDLRLLSRDLINDQIAVQPFTELIEQEVKKLRGLKMCEVVYTNQSTVCIDSYQEKSILLRIIQEFIQNSIKHSHCTEIRIHLLDEDNGHFLLILKDNGIGFDLNNQNNKGIGLNSIRKRINMLNGEVELQSDQGIGTYLKVKLHKP